MFDADLSSNELNENDTVHVPNIGFISAISNVKGMGFLAQIGLKTAINLANPKNFKQ